MRRDVRGILAAAACALASGAARASSVDCAARPARPGAVEAPYGKCLSCHAGSGHGPQTPDALDAAVCRRSSRLVEAMIGYARGQAALAFTDADAAAVRDRWAELQADKPLHAAANPRLLYLAAAENARLRALLPAGDAADPGGRRLEDLRARGPVFYDGATVQKSVQVDDTGGRDMMFLENPEATVYPRTDGRTGLKYADRGGLEFPWQRTAGTDLAAGAGVLRFFVPPEAGPMVETFRVSRTLHPERYGDASNETALLYGYQFLPGTVFGEVLTATNPVTGAVRPFEVRLREVQASGEWLYDVLRPFLDEDELAQAVAAAGGAWPADRAAPVEALAVSFDAFALARNNKATTALQPGAAVRVLPALAPAVVDELLARPFRGAFGAVWARGGAPGYAARGAGAYHVFPARYLGTHLKLQSSQCAQCHQDTQVNLRQFDPAHGVIATDDASDREWYGHMPGSTPQGAGSGLAAAGIFSFHPFAAASVAHAKFQDLPVAFDAALRGAGLLRVTTEER